MKRKQDQKRQKDIFTINIQDFIRNEEEEIEQLEFQVKSKKIHLPLHQFTKYVKISDNLTFNKTELIRHYSNELEKLIQHFDVKEKSISLFFDFLQERSVDVSCDEFIDFCRINKVFKVCFFSKYLMQFWQEHTDEIYFQLTLLIEYEKRQNTQNIDDLDFFTNNELISSIENNLKNNIEECISIDKFAELRLSTIYQLIKQSRKENNDNNDESSNFSDLLFEFINKAFDERYCLLSFIKVRQLSESNFQSLCNNYINSGEDHKIKYDNYLLCDLIYIKELKETQQTFKTQIDSLENKNKIFETQNSEITKINQNYKSTIESLEKKLEEQNSEITKNNIQYISKIESLEESKKQLEKQLENQQVQCDSIIKEYEKQIQTSNDQIQNDLAKIKELSEKNDQLSKENIDLKKSITELRNNSNPKISKKLNEVIEVFYENNRNIKDFTKLKTKMFFFECEIGNLDVVKYLISENGNKIDINLRSISNILQFMTFLCNINYI